MKFLKFGSVRMESSFLLAYIIFACLFFSCSCFTQFHNLDKSNKCNRCLGVVYQASLTSNEEDFQKIRLNKVFKETHSRREADVLIASGRVSVNNVPVTTKGGILVQPYKDIIHLDGKLIEGWEELNSIPRNDKKSTNSVSSKGSNREFAPNDVFQYIKYWKPIGTVCTTDRKVRGNIIDQLKVDGFEPDNRIYPVGRLDKDTTGLLVLTNDGRVPNAFLRSKHRKSKIYEVVVNRSISDEDIEQLKVSKYLS